MTEVIRGTDAMLAFSDFVSIIANDLADIAYFNSASKSSEFTEKLEGEGGVWELSFTDSRDGATVRLTLIRDVIQEPPK